MEDLLIRDHMEIGARRHDEALVGLPAGGLSLRLSVVGLTPDLLADLQVDLWIDGHPG